MAQSLRYHEKSENQSLNSYIVNHDIEICNMTVRQLQIVVLNGLYYVDCLPLQHQIKDEADWKEQGLKYDSGGWAQKRTE